MSAAAALKWDESVSRDVPRVLVLRGGPHSKVPHPSGTPTELNNPRNQDRK